MQMENYNVALVNIILYCNIKLTTYKNNYFFQRGRFKVFSDYFFRVRLYTFQIFFPIKINY